MQTEDFMEYYFFVVVLLKIIIQK